MANLFYNMLSEIMAAGFTITLLRDNSNLEFRFSIKITRQTPGNGLYEAGFEGKSLRETTKLAWNSLFSITGEDQIDDENDLEERGMIYSKNFHNDIGDRLKARYEAEDPPRLHRLYFDAIVRALNGQNKGIVVLAPIIDELKTSRTASVRVLSCFEAYGYVRITRIPNIREGGTSLEFEILRKM